MCFVERMGEEGEVERWVGGRVVAEEGEMRRWERSLRDRIRLLQDLRLWVGDLVGEELVERILGVGEERRRRGWQGRRRGWGEGLWRTLINVVFELEVSNAISIRCDRVLATSN